MQICHAHNRSERERERARSGHVQDQDVERLKEFLLARE